MRLVIVESPYAGDVAANVAYARECVLDCMERGESPFASHLFYTQVLDDNIFEQRLCGILAGLEWATKADATVVYIDKGITEGMRKGIDHADLWKRPVEYRRLK